jgi:hypothetical protein
MTLSSLILPFSEQAINSKEEWCSNLHSEFMLNGNGREDNTIPVNPLCLDAEVERRVRAEIYDLILCARRVSLKYLTTLSKPRADHESIVNAYLDAPRIAPIARPDGIIVNGQLKLVELNLDSGLGGIAEMSCIQNHLCGVGSAINSNMVFPDPLEQQVCFIAALVEKVRAKLGFFQLNVCIVPYADFSQLYLDQSKQLAAKISELDGVSAHVVFPETLFPETLFPEALSPEVLSGADFVRGDDRDYHIVYRDGSFVHEEARLEGMKRLLMLGRQTQSCIVGDPLDLAVEDKGAIALLSTLCATEAVTEYERTLIQKYIPWTRFIDNTEVVFGNETKPIVRHLIENKALFVMKRTHSHIGKDVVIGMETPDDVWKGLVQQAVDGTAQWVAQEFLSSDTYYFGCKQQNDKLEWAQLPYTLSPFVFGRQHGAWLVRVEKRTSKSKVFSLFANSAVSLAGISVLPNTLEGA